MTNQVTLRYATEDDIPVIHSLICDLAAYENMENLVEDNGEEIKKTLFCDNVGKCILAEVDDKVVGMALFFYNISTFKGKKGLYLEDLFVEPSFRGQGIGKALLLKLVEIAKEENCGRVEWWCLDWNKPSIAFYKAMGAEAMEDWTVYRVDEGAFDAFGREKE